MPKQPESTSALAKSENPMLDMIRTMAIVDPHHMMEIMQKFIRHCHTRSRRGAPNRDTRKEFFRYHQRKCESAEDDRRYSGG